MEKSETASDDEDKGGSHVFRLNKHLCESGKGIHGAPSESEEDV